MSEKWQQNPVDRSRVVLWHGSLEANNISNLQSSEHSELFPVQSLHLCDVSVQMIEVSSESEVGAAFPCVSSDQ